MIFYTSAVLKIICCSYAESSMSNLSAKVTNMERKIWTAAELEKMTPAERRAISQAAVVTDPADIPSETMAWARKVALEHIAATEQSSAS